MLRLRIRADPGVLILSKFAGAAQQLTQALTVNPYDQLEVAAAIRDAFLMSHDERVSRWQEMIETIRDQDVILVGGCFLGRAYKQKSEEYTGLWTEETSRIASTCCASLIGVGGLTL